MFSQIEELAVKVDSDKPKAVEQPAPFTPGITQAMVREHTYRLYRDKPSSHPLTLADWLLAEKDLIASMEAAEAGVEIKFCTASLRTKSPSNG